jgi:hypothetical protein
MDRRFRAMIELMMKAVNTSETSVSIYKTSRRNISEGSHLHILRHEKMTSHFETACLISTENEFSPLF